MTYQMGAKDKNTKDDAQATLRASQGRPRNNWRCRLFSLGFELLTPWKGGMLAIPLAFVAYSAAADIHYEQSNAWNTRSPVRNPRQEFETARTRKPKSMMMIVTTNIVIITITIIILAHTIINAESPCTSWTTALLATATTNPKPKFP